MGSDNHSLRSASNYPLRRAESKSPPPLHENNPPQRERKGKDKGKGKGKGKEREKEWYHQISGGLSLPPGIPAVFGLPRSSILPQPTESIAPSQSESSAEDVEMAPPDRGIEPLPITIGSSPPDPAHIAPSSPRPSNSSRTKDYDADDEDGRGDDHNDDQVSLG